MAEVLDYCLTYSVKIFCARCTVLVPVACQFTLEFVHFDQLLRKILMQVGTFTQPHVSAFLDAVSEEGNEELCGIFTTYITFWW